MSSLLRKALIQPCGRCQNAAKTNQVDREDADITDCDSGCPDMSQQNSRDRAAPNQKLWPKVDFGEFHHVYPLEHFRWVATRYLWVYKFEKIHEA